MSAISRMSPNHYDTEAINVRSHINAGHSTVKPECSYKYIQCPYNRFLSISDTMNFKSKYILFTENSALFLKF